MMLIPLIHNEKDLTFTTNRLVVIQVELYIRGNGEFPDAYTIKADDSEYTLQFDCLNKDPISPYTLNPSDLSNSDKQEIIFVSPDLFTKNVRLARFRNDEGQNGILTYACQKNDLDVPGLWRVRVSITEGDVKINYPDVSITVF